MDKRPPSDEATLTPGLWSDLQGGSLDAFERLYREQGPKMKSIALNMLGNVADAEDAIQETFMKAYRNMRTFRGDSAFGTWIYRILVNTCYDRTRKRRRNPETPAEGEGEGAPVAFRARESDHPLRLTLERSLAQLDERSRAVFLLFEVEGFRHAEIAGILDIREGTSKSLLFDAKRKLQRLLQGQRRPDGRERI